MKERDHSGIVIQREKLAVFQSISVSQSVWNIDRKAFSPIEQKDVAWLWHVSQMRQGKIFEVMIQELKLYSLRTFANVIRFTSV